jgi:predicted AlkP superfamily phosphohydrolase/phosphomutase
MTPIKKVVVLGLDGLEPKIVEPMLEAAELPALARLRSAGGYSRLCTTFPAQTPVAWSTFATGTNPGGHGIFDFIRRDPKTYLPDLSFSRYEQRNAFLPPRAVNLRRGTPLWELLGAAGIESSVLRCPCTYPPDTLRGRMLAGMGVPDLRGGLGTPTFYSAGEGVKAGESETVVPVSAEGSTIVTSLIGPRNPRGGGNLTVEIKVDLDRAGRKVVIRSAGVPAALEVREGCWSEWLKVKFKTGLFQSVRGMVRFYLPRLEPAFELYASPANFDPDAPLFPLSSPAEYAREVAQSIGTFYTTGMVEDHGGLNNGRFDEAAYLQQCDEVMRERQRMLLYELQRLRAGFLFCLFDTPDRLQHMFWRFREESHPANRGKASGGEYRRVIEDHYRACDAVVGEALRYADDQTLVMVLSDHGFNSFQRGINLNTWLHENGFLVLRKGVSPGEEAGEMLRQVDWGQTKAYALGLGSIYLNLAGREEQGIVSADEAERLKASLAERLSGLVDTERGTQAVRGVVTREQVYRGPYAVEAPDLLVNCAAGYRASWGTALGGVPHGLFEDNDKRWSGDHIIDPALVPGTLFINRAFRGDNPSLLDLAPTILAALGVPRGPVMEGENLLR